MPRPHPRRPPHAAAASPDTTARDGAGSVGAPRAGEGYTGFLLGSPPVHTASDRPAVRAWPAAAEPPSSRPMATVHCATGSRTPSGYPTASSVCAHSLLLASFPSLPDAPQYAHPYKAAHPPPSSPPAPASNPYAAYLALVSPAFAASSAMAISSRDNAHIAHRAETTPPAPPEALDEPPPSPAAAAEDDDGRPARKHACPMCHKAFDR